MTPAQWNSGVATFNQLFADYVQQIASGLASAGVAVTVEILSGGDVYTVPDQALLHVDGYDVLITKYHFDTVPADQMVRNILANLAWSKAIGGQVSSVAQPGAPPGPPPPGRPGVPPPPGPPPAPPSAPAIPGVPGGVIARAYAAGSFPLGRGGVSVRARARDLPSRQNLAPIPGPPPVTIATTIITVVAGLFRLFGGGVSRAVKQALEGLRAAIAKTADELMRFTWRGLRALGRIIQAVGAIYVRVVRPVLDWLRDTIQRVVRIIDRILRPYFEWARRVTELVLEIYEKYVRPVLVVIQRVRQVLAVLKILRIGFARRLDAWLVRLQQRIMQPIQQILLRVNHIGGWLNVLISARAVLQRALYLRSLWQWQGSFFRAWWGWQSGYVSDAELQQYDRQVVPRTPREVAGDVETLVKSGAGPYAFIGTQTLIVLRRELGL